MFRKGHTVSLVIWAVISMSGCRSQQTVDLPPSDHGAPSIRLSQDSKKRERQEDSPELQALVAQEEDEAALKPDPPVGATAECLDETFSYAKLKKDACIGHRGILKWLGTLPAK